MERKALSEDEKDDLSDHNTNQQLAIYWCAKEAIYKRMSRNGVDFARQIEVERFTPHDEGELEATFIHKDGEEETFELNYEVFGDFRAQLRGLRRPRYGLARRLGLYPRQTCISSFFVSLPYDFTWHIPSEDTDSRNADHTGDSTLLLRQKGHAGASGSGRSRLTDVN